MMRVAPSEFDFLKADEPELHLSKFESLKAGEPKLHPQNLILFKSMSRITVPRTTLDLLLSPWTNWIWKKIQKNALRS